VVVSDAVPAGRIVNGERCGLVFKAGDPENFAQAVFQLTDASVREVYGRRGRAAVLERYNWEIDSRTLVNLFNGLEKES